MLYSGWMSGYRESPQVSSQAMEEVMYYATDDKVYAVLLTASHPQVLPKYEVNPGEKITGIQVVEYCEGKLEIPNTDKRAN